MGIGHGHVRPNPNGEKARCGGPAICHECATELANLKERDSFAFLTHLYNYVGPEVIEGLKQRAAMASTREMCQVQAELEGCHVIIQITCDKRKKGPLPLLRPQR